MIPGTGVLLNNEMDDSPPSQRPELFRADRRAGELNSRGQTAADEHEPTLVLVNGRPILAIERREDPRSSASRARPCLHDRLRDGS